MEGLPLETNQGLHPDIDQGLLLGKRLPVQVGHWSSDTCQGLKVRPSLMGAVQVPGLQPGSCRCLQVGPMAVQVIDQLPGMCQRLGAGMMQRRAVRTVHLLTGQVWSLVAGW